MRTEPPRKSRSRTLGLGFVVICAAALPGLAGCGGAPTVERVVGGELRTGPLVPREAYVAAIQAERAASEGDLDRALRLYRRAAKLVPSDLLLRARVGELLEALGRRTAASAVLESSLRRHPRSEALLLAYGRIAAARGEPRRALSLLSRARVAAPMSVPTTLELARVLHETGASERALAVLEELTSLATPPHRLLLHRQLELALFLRDQRAAARAAGHFARWVPADRQRVIDAATMALDDGHPALARALLESLGPLESADALRARAMLAGANAQPAKDSSWAQVLPRLPAKTWNDPIARRGLVELLEREGLGALADEVAAKSADQRSVGPLNTGEAPSSTPGLSTRPPSQPTTTTR